MKEINYININNGIQKRNSPILDENFILISLIAKVKWFFFYLKILQEFDET